jgi:LysR family transcriptional activator of nhaA
MDELNYRHLLYFWVVTREGSVTRASQMLHVAQPTISAQLKKFEQTLGARLFRRAGRRLELTETGRKVQRYARQIFTLGEELCAELNGRAVSRPSPFVIGVSRDLPAALVEPLITKALEASEQPSVSVVSSDVTQLLADLAGQRVDVVLANETGETRPVRTHHQLLVEAGVVLAGPAELAALYRRGFPGSLQAAPLVLPSSASPLRAALDRWFMQHRLQPQVVAEVDDEAWQRRWCALGRGLMATVKPCPPDDWQIVGKLAGVTWACYAITLSRQPAHPATRALLATT